MAKSERPKSQFDDPQRVVSLENLYAMCARASGMCHRYAVEKVTKSRIHVSYSNPNEYGHNRPVCAVFPCYPSTFGGDEIPAVVLDIVRTYGSREYRSDMPDDEIWQSFDPVVNAPKLWRNPVTRTWQTEDEAAAWRAAKDAETEDDVPACATSMGCLCAGHARGNLATDECDTNE